MAVRTEIAITPVTGTIGAEVAGVDLAAADDDAIELIRQALRDHLVLFFRDQDLTPEEHRDFGSRFGELHVHPNFPGLEGVPEVLPLVNEAGDDYPKDIALTRDAASLRWDSAGTWIGDFDPTMWHSDVSFEERPAMGSILYCRECPPVGGDTMWANQYVAFETLSRRMRDYLDGLVAVHSDAWQRAWFGIPGEPRSNEHPVVRTHPETGRKALYVNRLFTTAIKDIPAAESKAVLEFLFQHSARPEFCCRFRWRRGSIAFWDNRPTMHFAVDDYHGHRRVVQRVTIVGERPV
jgi:taurine dioxygenase